MAPPGERFITYYRRRHQPEEKAWRSSLMISISVLLIATGIALGAVPGVPGIFLAIPGLALLVARIRVVGHMLDRTEIGLRRFGRRVKRLFRRRDPS